MLSLHSKCLQSSLHETHTSTQSCACCDRVNHCMLFSTTCTWSKKAQGAVVILGNTRKTCFFSFLSFTNRCSDLCNTERYTGLTSVAIKVQTEIRGRFIAYVILDDSNACNHRFGLRCRLWRSSCILQQGMACVAPPALRLKQIGMIRDRHLDGVLRCAGFSDTLV